MDLRELRRETSDCIAFGLLNRALNELVLSCHHRTELRFWRYKGAGSRLAAEFLKWRVVSHSSPTLKLCPETPV